MTRASVALRALMQVCARACVRAGVGGRVGVRCQCVGVGVRVHIRVCSRCLSLGRLGRPTRAGGCASSHAPQHACDSASASEGTEPHMDVDMERARDGGSGCAGRREGRCPEEGTLHRERGRPERGARPERIDAHPSGRGSSCGRASSCGLWAEGGGTRPATRPCVRHRVRKAADGPLPSPTVRHEQLELRWRAAKERTTSLERADRTGRPGVGTRSIARKARMGRDTCHVCPPDSAERRRVLQGGCIEVGRLSREVLHQFPVSTASPAQPSPEAPSRRHVGEPNRGTSCSSSVYNSSPQAR